MSPPSLLFLLVISQLLLYIYIDTVNKAYAVLVTVNLNITE